MKVLLINPPSNSPQPVMPLGLACLAAALRENNAYVSILDAWVERLTFEALAARLEDLCDYNLVGVTVSTPAYAYAMKTVQIIRHVLPRAKIIIGGPHPSALPEECIRDNPEVDFVAVGEGEKLIVELTEALVTGQADFSKIKGLVYRDQDEIINNGRTEVIRNLDVLPFPARDLLPMRRYQSHPPYRLHKAYATLVTSRGCPYQCTYCSQSVSGQHYRAQSAARVVREIEFLVTKHKIKQIHFYDDDFTLNMRRVEELCDLLLEKKIKILWSCVTRVDLVNESLLSKMRRAGCWLIAYGVESGDQNILDRAKKGYRIEDVKNAFALTRRAGIRILGYFIAGLPGETYATLDATVKLAIFLEPDFIAWSITAIYPGSHLYQQVLNGELGDDSTCIKAPIVEHYSNVSGQSPFAHGHAFIYEGEIPRAYVMKTVNKTYRRFYFRLRYIIRFVVKLHTLTEALSYLKTALSFLAWQAKRR